MSATTFDTAPAARRTFRRPLGAFGRLTVSALVGLALAYGLWAASVLRGLIPPVLFAPIALVCAAIVATGRRPAPLVATLICAAGFAAELPLIPGHLDDPFGNFLFNVILIPLLFCVAIPSSVAAIVQNYRQDPAERRAALIGLLARAIG